MKSAMQKDFWREIGHTRSRFFSIMILVALSVAFLSGLKATAPDMKHTGDDYLDSLHLADIQILSTLGLTDDDIEALKAQDSIENAEGEYVIDAFASSDTADVVVKILSLSDAGINDVSLREGRMPERADECVVEEKMLSMMDIAIGDTLTLTPGSKLSDALAQDSFTVVGTVRSPVYIAVDRGASTLGSGVVKAYLYLPRAAFALDYYTAAYARVTGAAEMTAFYDEYDDYIEDVIDSLDAFGDARAALRHDSLVDEANETLNDAQQELDDARREADDKLSDAQRELADARKKLDNGWRDYRDGQRELSDSRAQLDEAYEKLQDGEQQYKDGLEEYNKAAADYEKGLGDYENGKKEYDEGQKKLSEGEEELLAGWQQLEAGEKQLDALGSTVTGALSGSGSPYENAPEQLLEDLGRGDAAAAATTDAALEGMRTQLRGGIAQAESTIAELNASLTAVNAALAQLSQVPTDGMTDEELNAHNAQIAALNAQKAQLEAGISQAQAQKAQMEQQLSQLEAVSAATIGESKRQLDQGRADYRSGSAQLAQGRRDLAEGKKELDEARTELDDAPAQLAEAKQKLDDSRAELDDGWKEYEDGERQYADGALKLADAYRELQKGESDYRKGLSEYRDGKAEADEKIADAQKKIDDARRDVADIESCEWYIFSRSYNPGYTGFGQDAERMANLASVFPIIFFLVAALVCLTTMTRMVEEQRVQIGSLKAMGYSGLAISRKYIFYGLLPSLGGGLLGLAFGYILFPKMIFTAYQIMYQVPDLELRAYPEISVFSVLAAVACTTLATLWACLATLRETPASLMRPRTPKAGKRVFLEYIKPLWKRMSFTHKVTARNLFRYQKRFWMTVIGIGGCTALIIAGFGMRSSLLFTMSRQYNDLFHYSAQVTLSDNVLPEERQAVETFLDSNARVVNYIPCAASSATAVTPKYSTTAYIEVMEADDLPKAIELYDYKSGDTITMQDDGVYIDQKLSELLDVKVGDTFFLEGDEPADVTVAGIYEHYTGHFIYMTPACYESTFGKAPSANAYLMNFTSDDEQTCGAIFERLLELNGVVSTSRMRDTQDTYTHSMERVDFVVVIVILAAAALAMVVLFNLSNINITERQRELATIKLLGFYDGEVSAYVYRENIVLTIFGIALGCFMGHWLHLYLVRSTEIDLMMFGRQTEPSAYVYAAILTALFSLLVNVLAHFKMKKIDMVESLKSAE